MDPSSIRRYLTTRLDEQPGTKIQYGHPSPLSRKRRRLKEACA